MEQYQPSKFEGKWQKLWQDQKIYQAEDFSDKDKSYVLIEFPYPSGEGLHVGHCLSFTAQDVVARYLRMTGHNVLYPIGWDAFGLPTENFAIKNKIHPREATANNIANFKRQITSLGISFDWSREVNTTDPNYYKWTQWIFLKFLAAGLAEKKEVPINWCPECKTGLAFEEVVDGACERCGSPVQQRTIKQWVLKITEYADRLIDDLETVDYLPHIKKQQIDWIGRSEGAEINFKVEGYDNPLTVFTTRPDTIYGVTFMVVAPEHPLVHQVERSIENLAEVKNYVEQAIHKTERQRQEQKEKTGVELKGVKVVNPLTQKQIPVFVADYVMMSYGTGAIMAVPAHDERDWEFAKKYDLEIVPVISGGKEDEVYTGEGKMINSDKFDGLETAQAWDKIVAELEKKGLAKKTVKYKLRDWIFSRQHYWGEPIPVIHCSKCGIVPVPEKDLPVELPDVEYYEPTDTGESPLANIDTWVNVSCPKCKGEATRETDTMPNWAGSSWYFLRYTDPKNDLELASKEKLQYWLPVDLYNGGMEHTTLHLLYSRFWHKFLYDQKIVPTLEPYAKRVSHGMVLGPDNQKMSKSRGNVINPDTIVEKYGADALRAYEMFMGVYEDTKVWSDESLQGVFRFLKKVWNFYTAASFESASNKDIEVKLQETIKKITDDIERRSFNTVVSHLMIMLNSLTEVGDCDKKTAEQFLILLAPIAPHITEELWSKLGNKESIHLQSWPKFDASLIASQDVTMAIQVNGKVRAEITINPEISEEELKEKVLKLEAIQKHLGGKEIKKFIYIKNKIINIVC